MMMKIIRIIKRYSEKAVGVPAESHKFSLVGSIPALATKILFLVFIFNSQCIC